MKLFKTIMILSLAVLSLGSSVAFGSTCEQVTGAGIATTKTVAGAQGSSPGTTTQPVVADPTK